MAVVAVEVAVVVVVMVWNGLIGELVGCVIGWLSVDNLVARLVGQMPGVGPTGSQQNHGGLVVNSITRPNLA